MTNDWRKNIPAEDLEHWERVRAEWERNVEAAEREGLTYRYLPWAEVRNRYHLIGKRASVAYWTRGFGELPWGHQHAHPYLFAFQKIINIGADFIAFEKDGSRHMTSYDTVCIVEPVSRGGDLDGKN